MRCYSLMLAVGVVAFLAAVRIGSSTADSAPPEKKVEKAGLPSAKDWKEDPVCRMVFFAVLEGLYTDGVSSEAVDSVVGRKAKGGPDDLKATFVIQCPLCHPVYEAFCLYQQRPGFTGDKVKRDTFGKGLSPDLERGLKSKNLLGRQNALQVVVQRWVERRLIQMRLTEKESKEWSERLQSRSAEGTDRLRQARKSDPAYKGWSGYGFCAACKGGEGACSVLQPTTKKK